jgi:hypothetical protein
MDMGGTRVERVRECRHHWGVSERDVRVGRMGGEDAVHVVSSVLYLVCRYYACRLGWQEETQAVTGDIGQYAMHMMTTNETNNAFPSKGRG